jgi:hypothetical protein
MLRAVAEGYNEPLIRACGVPAGDVAWLPAGVMRRLPRLLLGPKTEDSSRLPTISEIMGTSASVGRLKNSGFRALKPSDAGRFTFGDNRGDKRGDSRGDSNCERRGDMLGSLGTFASADEGLLPERSCERRGDLLRSLGTLIAAEICLLPVDAGRSKCSATSCRLSPPCAITLADGLNGRSGADGYLRPTLDTLRGRLCGRTTRSCPSELSTADTNTVASPSTS